MNFYGRTLTKEIERCGNSETTIVYHYDVKGLPIGAVTTVRDLSNNGNEIKTTTDTYDHKVLANGYTLVIKPSGQTSLYNEKNKEIVTSYRVRTSNNTVRTYVKSTVYNELGNKISSTTIKDGKFYKTEQLVLGDDINKLLKDYNIISTSDAIEYAMFSRSSSGNANRVCITLYYEGDTKSVIVIVNTVDRPKQTYARVQYEFFDESGLDSLLMDLGYSVPDTEDDDMESLYACTYKEIGYSGGVIYADPVQALSSKDWLKYGVKVHRTNKCRIVSEDESYYMIKAQDGSYVAYYDSDTNQQYCVEESTEDAFYRTEYTIVKK